MSKTQLSNRLGIGLLAAGALLAAGTSSTTEAQDLDVAIVVNSAVPDKALSPDDIEALFRSVTKKWSNGDPVVRFTYPPNHPLRVSFEKAVLRLSPTEAQRFWIDQRIRGTAQPPRAIDSPQVMSQVIGGLRGSFGYVPARAASGNMRVVAYVRQGQLVPAK